MPVNVPMFSSSRSFPAVMPSGATISIPVIRLWIPVYFASYENTRQPMRLLCLFDSGAPLCVVPHAVWTSSRLDWERLESPSSDELTAFGRTAQLGRIQVWLPTLGTPEIQRGPFELVAKFLSEKASGDFESARDEPALPAVPQFPLIGLNFFAEHRSEVRFIVPFERTAEAGRVFFP